MHIPKKYFHDRSVLVLLSTNAFLALLNVIIVLLKFDTNKDTLKLVQYRPELGLSSHVYSTSSATLISFIIFPLMVLVFHTLLGMQVYLIRRRFAVLVLVMGLLLLLFSLLISSLLLGFKI